MAFTTDGRVWPGGTCDINITGPGWPTSWQKAANAAVSAWNSAGANFSFIGNPSSQNHLAAYDLTAWNGWLGMTYTFPRTPQSLLTSGYIVMNLHYEWDPSHPHVAHSDTAGPYDLESALTHEFGHLLHLDDDATTQDVMKPVFSPRIRRVIGSDDRAGVRHLYPLLAKQDLPGLAGTAEIIVRGQVSAASYAVFSSLLRLPNYERPIPLLFSAQRLQIRDVLRGYGYAKPGQEIDILTIGGETPEDSMHVSSEASFAPNEDVVAFLGRDYANATLLSLVTSPLRRISINGPLRHPEHFSDSLYSVIGGFQGKYSVYRMGEEEFLWQPHQSQESLLTYRNLLRNLG